MEEMLSKTLNNTALVLTRRPNERIWIGENIILELVRTHGLQSTFRIIAPRDVKIDREEIRIKKILNPDKED